MSTFPEGQSRVARDLFALALLLVGLAAVMWAALKTDVRLAVALAGAGVFVVGLALGGSSSDGGRR